MNEIQNPNQPSNSHELITDCNTDKMKTAFQTLSDTHSGLKTFPDGSHDTRDEYEEDLILEAMEQYSQQQACEFARYLETFEASSDDVLRMTPYEQLYEQWKESLNK